MRDKGFLGLTSLMGQYAKNYKYIFSRISLVAYSNAYSFSMSEKQVTDIILMLWASPLPLIKGVSLEELEALQKNISKPGKILLTISESGIIHLYLSIQQIVGSLWWKIGSSMKIRQNGKVAWKIKITVFYKEITNRSQALIGYGYPGKCAFTTCSAMAQWFYTVHGCLFSLYYACAQRPTWIQSRRYTFLPALLRKGSQKDCKLVNMNVNMLHL